MQNFNIVEVEKVEAPLEWWAGLISGFGSGLGIGGLIWAIILT